jgi:hypothetical protein
MSEKIDWQQFRCRCSAITMMLSEKQGEAPLTENQLKKIEELEAKDKRTEKQDAELCALLLRKNKPKEIVLSDTCIGYLMEHYAWVTQRMVSVSKEMDIDYLNKGKIQEPDGIKLLNDVDGQTYLKYEGERISNEFLSGKPDIFVGKEIYAAEKITDLKNIWDYPGFLRKIHAAITPANDLQIKGYMDITGAKEGEVANVLTNMPETIVNDYRRRLFYKMGVATDEAPEYKEAEQEMLRSFYFDIIPKHQRVFKLKVEPLSDFDRQKIYDKVKICREWLFKFDEQYQKLNQ